MHPSFRSKIVCQLSCRYCIQPICKRGMKAILLADTRVELYSTDTVPAGRVQLVAEDYLTRNCNCKIRDVACLGCGNVIGYHVGPFNSYLGFTHLRYILYIFQISNYHCTISYSMLSNPAGHPTLRCLYECVQQRAFL
ncbi:Protein fam72a [Chytriomyces hyalinus]|nr:Protein fam72a [Chytriomyces hyalinus]